MPRKPAYPDSKALLKKAGKLLADSPKRTSASPGRDTRQLSHGLSVNGAELKMQNDELRRSLQELGEEWKRANEDLEKKVAERTAELSRTNRELQREIADHEKADRALAQSEAKFSRAFHASASPFAITTLDEGRFVDVNETFLRGSGFTRDEVIGHTAHELQMWADPDERASFVALLKERGSVRSFESVRCHKSGELGYALMSASIVEINGIDYVISEATDITDRKKTEEALQASEHRFRLFIDNAPAAIAMFDTSMRYLAASSRWLSDYKLQERDIIGKSHYEVFPEMPERWKEIHRRCLAGAVEKCEEDPFPRSDGRTDWVRWEIRPWYERTGKIGGLIIFTEVITDRKEMEAELRRSHDEMELRVKERTAELRQSRERFQTLVDLLPEAVFEVDVRGRCTYANRQALQYIGRTFEELDRGELNMFYAIVDEDRLRATENVRKILEGEVRQGGDYTIRRKDGSQFPAFVRVSRIERNGEAVGLRGIMIDITAPRRAEAERARLEEQLHHAVKMQAIGTLAGGIAHDFNNMLAVIIGNAELALDDEHLDDIRMNLGEILRASKRSRDLVQQILTFSRKREVQKKALMLTPLIEETVQLLRGSLPSTVRIKTDIRTERGTVFGDASQIQQVLMNLATNAVQAMTQEGTLSIRLSDKTFVEAQHLPDGDLQPGRYLRLTVRDTGTGIRPEILERIFDPFFTTKDPSQGTGMGLAVVHGIVRSHGGAITVSSRMGRGSAFTIFLPSVGSAAAEEPIAQSPLQRGNERVLVVDDEDSVVGVVSETLKRLGYEVTTALSGPEGWKKFARDPSRYDLVITDQIMPEITGLQLAERMLGQKPDLPVILSTGYSEAVSAEEARSAGITEFLMKPIERSRLAEVVRRVLDQRNSNPRA